MRERERARDTRVEVTGDRGGIEGGWYSRETV